jgi:hypothetical protein
MLFRIRRSAARRWFDWATRSVNKTPPVKLDPRSSVHVVTQLHPPDLWMYAVAIKTFTRFVPIRGCSVVADRLNEEHREFLRHHVTNVSIVSVRDVDTSGFPTGGTWERLLHILELAREHYTIQLDADTITFDTPREVVDCINNGRSFTLGTSMGREVVAAHDLARQLSSLAGPDNHVQLAAELAFAKLSDPGIRYIRGNSAFAGFAPGSTSREWLKGFSDAMAAALGDRRWREWGSEQVASNYCVANSREAVVLPLERYRYFDPSADLAGAVFLHFIGTYRFSGGVYRRLARDAVAKLAAPAAA